MKRQEVLDRAGRAVSGDRDKEYGAPENSFQTIGDYWSIHLGVTVTPSDVAIMLALLKIARLGKNPSHEDSWVDLTGYGACGGEVATREPLYIKLRGGPLDGELDAQR